MTVIELHKVETTGVGGKFRVTYKHNMKDINDVTVSIPYHIKEKTIAEIDEEIVQWQAQETNCLNQIAKLNTEKIEIGKL